MGTAPTNEELKRYCLAKARKETQDGKWYPAIRNYKAALDYDCSLLDEPEWKVRFELASVYANAKFLDQAVQYYESALELSPPEYRAEIHTDIGIAHHEAHKYSEAIAELEPVRDQAPTNCTERILLCLAASHSKRRRTGDLDKALGYYDQLFDIPETERETRNWEIDNHRGFVCLENKNYDLALEYFTRALNSPYCISKGDVRNNMGRVFQEKGHSDAAAEQFELVLSCRDINPTTEGYARMCLGDILVEKKDRFGAAKAYSSARRLFQEARILGIASDETVGEFLRHIDQNERVLGVNFILKCPLSGGECSHSIDSGDANHVFVSMPFGKSSIEHEYYSALYDDAIAPAAADAGLEAIRVDRTSSGDDSAVFCKICRLIQSARFIIADVSGSNPNVMHEIGLAQAIGKTVLPIRKEGEDIPFNIQGFNCTGYNNKTDLAVILRGRIQEFAKPPARTGTR